MYMCYHNSPSPTSYLLGTVNRAIGLLPFLLPGVLPLYDEMNKVNQKDDHAPVSISRTVGNHLRWLEKMLKKSKGVSISRNKMWEYADQDPLFVHINVLTTGFAIWIPQSNEAYKFSFESDRQVPETSLPALWLFAINYAVFQADRSHQAKINKILSTSGRIKIFVDSKEMVTLFETLKPHKTLDGLFLNVIQTIIEADKTVRVSPRNKEDTRLETLLSCILCENRSDFDNDYPEILLKNIELPLSLKEFLPEPTEPLTTRDYDPIRNESTSTRRRLKVKQELDLGHDREATRQIVKPSPRKYVLVLVGCITLVYLYYFNHDFDFLSVS